MVGTMKIAIVCPIGDLNRFGYWRNARVCLESWKVLGDLFLIHSSRTAIPFRVEAEYIRGKNTLMKMVDDQEWFDHRLVADNTNVGIEAARKAGYDVAITICVNWYVEQPAAQHIEHVCQDMLLDKRTHEFLYRRIQIGERLFSADLETIAIVNLQQVKGNVVRVLVDRIEIDGQSITGLRGNFSHFDSEAYIDCEYEITLDEFKAKVADTRNYEDILPKRHGVDWAYWERYYRARADKMIESYDALLPVGMQIALNHPAGAFGDWLLRERAAA